MPFMWAIWLCRFVQTSAAVLLVGTGTLRLLAHGTDLGPTVSVWRGLAWLSGGFLLVAGTLQLGLTAAEMSGQSLASTLSDGTLPVVLSGTRFGAVWTARMVLVAGWIAFTSAAARWRWPRGLASIARELIGWLLSVVLLGSLVFAGHAQASEKSTWLLPVAVCHAVAAGVWPGGLLPLALLLGQAHRHPALIPSMAIVTRRFSRLCAAVVGVMALSGVLNAVGMIGTPTALWTTTYGRLVLCKGALFILLVGVGAINRRLLQPREPTDPTRAMWQLWRNVTVECVLAVGVLLATEALGTVEPPGPAR